MMELESLPVSFLADLRTRLASGAVTFDSLSAPISEVCRDALAADLEAALRSPDRTDRATVAQIIRHAILGQQFDLLERYGLPNFPYCYLDRYEDNLAAGPPLSLEPRTSAYRHKPTRILGRTVYSPIGIGSSVLTGSPAFIEYFASRGYGVLTLKTVRTVETESYPGPNWSFVREADLPSSGDVVPLRISTGLSVLPKDLLSSSTVNSFGLPSPPLDVWTDYVRSLTASLRPDVLLIVSVVGSYDLYSGKKLELDFVEAATAAVEAGATAVELNFSCPTVPPPPPGKSAGGDALLCEDVDAVERIVAKVRDAIGDVSLVLKLALLDYNLTSNIIQRCGDRIDGIAAINTVRVEVLNRDGEPLFPPPPDSRRWAGLSGSAIRNAGVSFVQDLASLREKYSCKFDILGMGGVLSVDDYKAYREAGADVVQTVTGAFVNPGLAEEILQSSET